MPDDPMITDERPQRHRAGAWVVLLIGAVGLGIGVMQWRGSFAEIFSKRVGQFKTPAEIEAQRVEEMKTKDTDGDGLNDYEESRVYLTSPYLTDSDSDGMGDREELASGEDPNCAKGSDCGSLAGAIDAQASLSATASAQLAGQEEEVVRQLLNPTPEQIRQLLLETGIKAEDIEGIDDATLLDLYRQALLEAQENLSTQQ